MARMPFWYQAMSSTAYIHQQARFFERMPDTGTDLSIVNWAWFVTGGRWRGGKAWSLDDCLEKSVRIGEVLTEEYGPGASAWPERITGGKWQAHGRYRLYCRLPLSRTLAAASLGVVGHSQHVCSRLRRWIPDLPVQLIPH